MTNDVIFWVGVAAAVANPLITALATTAEARKLTKVLVSLALAVAAGTIAALSDQSGSDWPTLVAAAFGVAQIAYRAADSALEVSTGKGINEQPLVMPASGLR